MKQLKYTRRKNSSEMHSQPDKKGAVGSFQNLALSQLWLAIYRLVPRSDQNGCVILRGFCVKFYYPMRWRGVKCLGALVRYIVRQELLRHGVPAHGIVRMYFLFLAPIAPKKALKLDVAKFLS